MSTLASQAMEHQLYPANLYNMCQGPSCTQISARRQQQRQNCHTPMAYRSVMNRTPIFYEIQNQPGLGLAQLPRYHHQLPQSHFPYQPPHTSFVDANQPMAYMQSDEDLAEFQQLSNEYESSAVGPLVGVRQSSDAISTEYAAADPIYRIKTAALPSKYAYYRTCKGDGRCGWRAIAFGYFESLLRLRDGKKFAHEESRLRSLSSLVSRAGTDASIYDDFVDELHTLLRSTAETLETPTAETRLVEAFNDEDLQNSIITSLRVLTDAWIKTHEDDFAPFLLPLSVADYCAQYIMPHTAEINDVGITALTDVLLKPAGVSLEIIYLDRSQGEEANVHHYGPPASPLSTARLLYRPGHYDLLYKSEDIVQHPLSNIDIHVAYSTKVEDPPFEHGRQDIMTMIPGMSIVNNHPQWASAEIFHGPMFDHRAQITMQQPQPQPLLPHMMTSVSPIAPTFAPVHPSHIGLSPESMYDVGYPPSSNSFRPAPQTSKDIFRPVTQMLNLPPQTDAEFRTAQFIDSHFNQAHFMNPDFHPEEWRP